MSEHLELLKELDIAQKTEIEDACTTILEEGFTRKDVLALRSHITRWLSTSDKVSAITQVLEEKNDRDNNRNQEDLGGDS